MPRVTEAQRIEQANEEAALVFFREALWLLPDPRRRQGTRSFRRGSSREKCYSERADPWRPK